MVMTWLIIPWKKDLGLLIVVYFACPMSYAHVMVAPTSPYHDVILSIKKRAFSF